jgi:hypothetical protein
MPDNATYLSARTAITSLWTMLRAAPRRLQIILQPTLHQSSTFTIHLPKMRSSFSAAGPLLTACWARLHRNAGHASYSDKKSCLAKANLWDEKTHDEALKEILKECAGGLAKGPQSYPRVSLSSTKRGEELCIDVIYLEGIPQSTRGRQIYGTISMFPIVQQANLRANHCPF